MLLEQFKSLKLRENFLIAEIKIAPDAKVSILAKEVLTLWAEEDKLLAQDPQLGYKMFLEEIK